MKRTKIFSISVVLALIFFALASRAGILIGGYTLVNITTSQTNSPSFSTNVAYAYIPQVTVTNASISATNSYYGVFRFSLDGGITFFTNNSPVFTPTNLTASQYVIPAQSASIPIVIQFLFVTNTVNTGIIGVGLTSP